MALSDDRPNEPEGGDPALALLYAQPFRITRPARQTLPFVFASPHSGRVYPAGLAAASRLDALTLRRSEDAFVDELFAAAPGLGAPLIAARFPRAYCDVNRGPAELDTAMFSGPLDLAVEAPTARVTAGLGVIPRIVRDGAEIYRRKLDPAEAKARLDFLYRPYHAALAALVAETVARFGMAIVVDCHSMPSALAVPDIVLGDRYGASAPAALTAHAEHAFTDAGFTLARNTPYAGGYTTLVYGKSVSGCHALQIEINRNLYLHENTLQRRAGFDLVQRRLTDVITQLVRIDPAALGRYPLAAE